MELRCPRCNYGPLHPNAKGGVICMRCGHLLVAPKGSLLDQYAGAKLDAQDRSMEVVVVTCGKCKRAVRSTRGHLLDRISKGSKSCQYCGAALEFPADLQDAVNSAASTAKLPRTVACPCCGRSVQTDPERRSGLQACAFCTLKFAVDEAGPRLGPCSEGPLASEANVTIAVSSLPQGGVNDSVRLALLGRARKGELVRGEAETIVTSLVALQAWKGSTRPELPLPVTDAEMVVQRLLFKAPLVRTSDEHGNRTVILTYPRRMRREMDRGSLARGVVTQTLGAVSLNTFGVGWVLTPSGWEDATQSNEILESDHVMVTLTPGDGTTQFHFTRESAGGVKRLVSEDDEEVIAVEMWHRRSQLIGYFALLAVFGRWAHGVPLIAATTERIADRLGVLFESGDHARTAALLRFKHEPIDIAHNLH